jgi:hypothetical protein
VVRVRVEQVRVEANGTVGTTSRFLYGTRKSLRADYTHKLDRRKPSDYNSTEQGE